MATGTGQPADEGEGDVILRVIRGRAGRDRVTALRADLVARLGEGPAPAIGPDRYHLGARASGESEDVLVLSCWPSAEAVEAGDRQDISPLRVASRHLKDLTVAHFEVDLNLLRDPDVHPIALRVATGRFSHPGTDIQMQELLRDRLHTIGEEMFEAYVGRRLVGRAVDVAFVSAWQARPSDHPLEDAFWPDISLRYDTFDVEVYGPVA